MVLIRIDTWVLTHDATDFDPFDRCEDTVTICLALPGTLHDVRERSTAGERSRCTGSQTSAPISTRPNTYAT